MRLYVDEAVGVDVDDVVGDVGVLCAIGVFGAIVVVCIGVFGVLRV